MTPITFHTVCRKSIGPLAYNAVCNLLTEVLIRSMTSKEAAKSFCY